MDREPMNGGGNRSYPRRTPPGYDGVEYEKTRKLMNAGSNTGPTRYGNGGYNRGYYDDNYADSGGNGKSRTPFFIFYVLLLLVAMVVCVVVFSIAFKTVTGAPPSINVGQGPAAALRPSAAAPPAVAAPGADIMAVVGNVDLAGQSIELIQTDNNDNPTYELSVTAGAPLKDAYGKAVRLANFSVGDIVNASFDPKGNALLSMDKSGKAWYEMSCVGVTVNQADKQLTNGANTYSFNSKLVVRDGGNNYDLSKISPADTVDLSGYGGTVWYVGLVTGHGTITITNAAGITGGTVTLDDSDSRALAEGKPITAQEGDHKLVIKGSNIQRYETSVTVTKNQDTPIDLTDKITLTTIKISFTCNVEDYTMTIDGSPVPAGTDVSIPPGTHQISVSKDGYASLSKEFNLTEDTTLDINLQPDDSQQAAPPPDDSQPAADQQPGSPQPEQRTGSVTIMAVPENSRIFIDGKDMGTAPLTIKGLTFGKHTVIGRYPGYTDYAMELTVDSAESTYQLLLQPLQPVRGGL